MGAGEHRVDSIHVPVTRFGLSRVNRSDVSLTEAPTRG